MHIYTRPLSNYHKGNGVVVFRVGFCISMLICEGGGRAEGSSHWMSSLKVSTLNAKRWRNDAKSSVVPVSSLIESQDFTSTTSLSLALNPHPTTGVSGRASITACTCFCFKILFPSCPAVFIQSTENDWNLGASSLMEMVLPVLKSYGVFLASQFFGKILLQEQVRSGDAEALFTLKSAIDPLNSLSWQQGIDVCKWQGVKECKNGRVTKLVVEYQNLSGILDAKILNQLDQLRVLSFKGNSLSGQIPSLSGLVNLKSLFLQTNNFSGNFPDSITGLHRLKVIVLAQNQISGPIPASLLKLSRLYVLYIEDNKFSGAIPPLNQTSLRFFNVSNNQLSGQIPATSSLIRFNTSSFTGNFNLCGVQIQKPCKNLNLGPSPSPTSPTSKPSSKHSKIIKIVAGSAGGKDGPSVVEVRNKGVAGSERGGEASGGGGSGSGSGMAGNSGRKQGGLAWEGEGLGSLVFLGAGDQQMCYSLEDLLKASAETLGRGTVGSTYKAVLESGFIVTVKRLRDSRYPRLDEFGRHMELLGRLRHPSLVPLRAYFQAREERLLVYDYFPNGSLFSLLHGGRGKKEVNDINGLALVANLNLSAVGSKYY
ncbi:LEUCINE-RICH REPEAT RECEPTOR-LIKE PROTEIN KINASE PXC1 [Salix koriyanagi]|uniref:LEUCINE-RICH REPEAT RECEPTOR-LIKE PROTEIN KINASE PXC1 n=1 Tax=Salix koriyanagi TaxID=2511006 RepID=A0A9Q0WLD8_9ROSI|nr:LEUCINE-RICH REPEAT RECEPTOR-LIKE PROTEIN KINASE PXC1 [Salix koriyanagi]